MGKNDRMARPVPPRTRGETASGRFRAFAVAAAVAISGALLFVATEASSQTDVGVETPEIEPRFVWETLPARGGPPIQRAEVPGGWFVRCDGPSGGGLTFYADPLRRWDGSTVPLED